MFQNYIIAAGAIQWSASPVFSAYSRRLPASDDRLVALSEPMFCTNGQLVNGHVFLVRLLTPTTTGV